MIYKWTCSCQTDNAIRSATCTKCGANAPQEFLTSVYREALLSNRLWFRNESIQKHNRFWAKRRNAMYNGVRGCKLTRWILVTCFVLAILSVDRYVRVEDLSYRWDAMGTVITAAADNEEAAIKKETLGTRLAQSHQIFRQRCQQIQEKKEEIVQYVTRDR